MPQAARFSANAALAAPALGRTSSTLLRLPRRAAVSHPGIKRSSSQTYHPGHQKHVQRAVAMASLPALPLPAALLAGGGSVGTAVLAALVLAGLWLLTSRRSSVSSNNGSLSLQGLPGPKQLPLLGNLADVGHPQAHQTVADWANRFGGIIPFKLLSNSLLITDPAEVEGILGRRGEEDVPRAPLIYKPLDPIYSPKGIPSFFTTPDTEMWAAVRKGCAPAFSPDNMRRAFPVVRDTVGAVSDHLAARVGTPAAAGGEDMQEAALRVALDSFALPALQHDFEARKYERCEVLETLPSLLAEFSKRALNPLRGVLHGLAPWLKDAAAFSSNLRTAHALWAQLAQEVRDTDLEAAEAAKDTSLRVCLAKIKDPATGQPLTQEQLAPQVAAFLVAGFETTAHSVAWALYEIARDQGVQDKLAAELAAAGLAWEVGRPGRQLELADLSSLSYLDQVWRESLRLHPVGSVGPIRQAQQDLTLRNGIKVPKGTMLWLSINAIHLSRFNYVDPYRFWPERWQQGQQAAEAGAGAGEATHVTTVAAEVGGQEGAGAVGGGGCPFGFGSGGQPTPSGNSAALQRSFMAFAYGPRDCMGQALANMEGKVMIAMLLSRFSFSVAPRMGSPEDVRAAEVNRLTMQSGKGVWLLLEPRAGVAE